MDGITYQKAFKQLNKQLCIVDVLSELLWASMRVEKSPGLPSDHNEFVCFIF